MCYVYYVCYVCYVLVSADVEDVGLGLEELAQDVDKFPYNQRSKARDVLKRLQAKCGQLEFMSEGVTLSSGGGRALGGGGRRADEVSLSVHDTISLHTHVHSLIHSHTQVPEARRALLSAQHGVDQTNESLENTLRTMDGIREAGRKTNDQLRAQRETLTSANDKIEDVNAYSVRAKKIIRTMVRACSHFVRCDMCCVYADVLS